MLGGEINQTRFFIHLEQDAQSDPDHMTSDYVFSLLILPSFLHFQRKITTYVIFFSFPSYIEAPMNWLV